ncbi:MAG: hypothetical protein QW552_08755 [Ignisphaera sp.]
MSKLMQASMCDETKPLLDIEGLAYIGKIGKLSIHVCGKNKKYIVIETVEGQRLCSPCADEDVISLSVKMIEHYSKSAKLVSS